MSKLLQILACVFALALLSAPARAQVVDLDLIPWTLDSDTMVIDGRTSVYTGLRFSQGAISIESDEGRATNGTENTRDMRFSGNVVIIVNDGRIECETADLHFVGSTLSNAVIVGSPATYELKRASAEDVTYAEAGRLKYDVARGVIEFSEQAKISESGNQISSNFLLYNILERRISADSTEDEDDRVRIQYTPTAEDTEAVEELQDDENQ